MCQGSWLKLHKLSSVFRNEFSDFQFLILKSLVGWQVFTTANSFGRLLLESFMQCPLTLTRPGNTETCLYILCPLYVMNEDKTEQECGLRTLLFTLISHFQHNREPESHGLPIVDAEAVAEMEKDLTPKEKKQFYG
jgi:hypothetical protein